jgi:DNA topoisomerase-1
MALRYLSLPKELGVHPDSGKPVLANNGRFGPYVQHDKEFRSLKKEDDVYTVELARALDLLSQPRAGRGQQKILRELGVHPEDERPVQLLEGKYGPYLKHRRTMASIPKDRTIESVTLDEALRLLAERAKKKPSRTARA